MKTEIEAKIKIDCPEKMAEKLKSAGAVFNCELSETDAYFADDDGIIVKKDCGLRLRRQVINGAEKITLTYKGPGQKTKFKTRQETEVQIDNAQAMEAILKAIGCRKTIVFEKKRSLWQLDDCRICIDQLPILGFFIEVEGASEESIAGVLAQLQLAESNHISAGYAALMTDKLAEAGMKRTEVLFR